VRELTRDEVNAFLDEQRVGRLGVRDGESLYVVPLIYARQGDALYMLTVDGRKTRAARECPSVCFEVDEYDHGTGSWTSAILWGRYEELHGPDRIRALAILGERHGARRSLPPAPSPDRPPAPSERPSVAFRIVVESASGRWVVRQP
jgi:nitroimidazol reductase NimA-like FMN-containing flavoprotein (pyridoxamine 5'-phosphate oxidase superfamily)